MLCSAKWERLYFSLDPIWEWNHFINQYPEVSFSIWHEKTGIALKCADNWKSNSSRADLSHLPYLWLSRFSPSRLTKLENKLRCPSFYDTITHFILWKSTGSEVACYLVIFIYYLLSFSQSPFLANRSNKMLVAAGGGGYTWRGNSPFVFLSCALKRDWKFRAHHVLQRM